MIRTLLLFGGLLVTMMSADAQSSPKVTKVESFDVIGISCRTNNDKEVSGRGCIGQQWGRLFSEGILDKIPDRLDKNVVAVYTDYASDKDGDYTYILGAKVKPGTNAPFGMVKSAVNAGRFAIFTSDKGPAQQVVPATWVRIWKTPKAEPGGDRLYQSDFEIYDARAVDPNAAQVDIFVRVR
jgi:predicted transcriptional regulator YdeE